MRVYGFAAVALGLIGLVWRDFAGVWQPVPLDVPHRVILACIVAVYFLVAGVAMQRVGTMAPGLLGCACLYLLAAVLWIPRVLHFPRMVGTWLGVAEELALAVAAIVAWDSLATPNGTRAPRFYRAGRVVFGLCAITFGIAHFLALRETARMVPSWIPPGQRFWAVATGIAHLLAGVAILSGVRALLAARLLTVMIVAFGVLVWIPLLVASPHDHMAWAGNAVNLAEAGAAWMIADTVARITHRHG